MAGLAMFMLKTTGALWHKGVCFYLLPPSGMRPTQKVPGAPARSQASFPIALKLFTKTHLIGSIKGYDVTSLYKNLVKNTKT
jgi:hypothetical protein